MTLPVLPGRFPAPGFAPGAAHSSESAEGVGWEIRTDVLARTTTAVTRQVSDYATPHDGHAREAYLGEVTVHRDTFAQSAHADATYDLTWPGVAVSVRSVMDVAVSTDGYHVTIRTTARHDDVVVSERSWSERLPR